MLIASLSVHEAAHAWAADRLGDPTARLLGRLSLNPVVHVDPIGTLLFPLIAMLTNVPLIGWAKPVPVNVKNLKRGRRDYVLVAAAGPASNLLIAVVASVALGLVTVSPMRVGEPNVSAPLAALLAQAVPLNILLAVFNMIPIPPLDGGNVLGGLLPQPIGAKYDALMRPYGFVLLYALILTRGFDYVVIPPARFLLSLLQ